MFVHQAVSLAWCVHMKPRADYVMRFKLWPRFAFKDIPRKRAALRGKQQKECEAFPLLADQIAEQQPSEDEVMRKRAVDWKRQEKSSRKQRADKWREARCRMAAHSSNVAAALRLAWNYARYPADPHGPVNPSPRYPLQKAQSHGCKIDVTCKEGHSHLEIGPALCRFHRDPQGRKCDVAKIWPPKNANATIHEDPGE